MATYPVNGTTYESRVLRFAIEPCAGGYHAPPPTPMTINPDPRLVCLPRFFVPRVKMTG